MPMLSIKQLPVQMAKVLERVDFNVPLDAQKKITDNSKVVAALPTIRYLLSQNCALILMSHLGRPDGQVNPQFSLKPVAQELSRLLALPVKMAHDCVGPEVRDLAQALQPGQVLLLENLRFHRAEENPELDPNFAIELASLGNFYVDDAFGCAHRAHASVVEVPKLFPNKAAPGFLMEKEIAFLGNALKNPERPFLALIGGAKVSTKIGALKTLIQHVDQLAIGGAMAFTFLKAQGIDVGNSLVEPEFLQEAKNILTLSQERQTRILLPLDVVVAPAATDDAKTKVVKVSQGISQGDSAFDIGPQTIKEYIEVMRSAHTILWNGPMGVFEKKPFAKGTTAIGKAFVASSAITIAGGGETLAALQQIAGKEEVTHLSTGGGATLEYIEKGTLPGIEALKFESDAVDHRAKS